MLKLVGKSALFGLLGLIAVPILVFFAVLVLGHVFDPRCGTPGDSGGCEMGAATLAIASALPACAFAFFAGLYLSFRSRNRAEEAKRQPPPA